MLAEFIREFAATTGRTVILTDEEARIAAWSDGACSEEDSPTLVGRLHLPAIAAMQTRATERIDEATARTLPGCAPGVTCVIEKDDEVRGTISILGDPNEVEQTCLLARRHVEICLEKHQFSTPGRFLTELGRHFARDLLAADGFPRHSLRELGAVLGYDFSVSRAVIVFDCTRKADEDAGNTLSSVSGTRRRSAKGSPEKGFSGSGHAETWIAAALHRHFSLDHRDFLTCTLQHRFVLLRKAFRNDEEERLAEECGHFVADMEKQGVSGSFGIGGIATSPEEYPPTHAAACEALLAGRLAFPTKRVFAAKELATERFLAFADRARSDHLEERVLGAILAQRNGEELLRTFDAWVRTSGSLELAASELHCHKNTLRYRLDRIHRLSGYDPRRIPDAMALWMALCSRRLHAGAEMPERKERRRRRNT